MYSFKIFLSPFGVVPDSPYVSQLHRMEQQSF